jgi:hypothetical protein
MMMKTNEDLTARKARNSEHNEPNNYHHACLPLTNIDFEGLIYA